MRNQCHQEVLEAFEKIDLKGMLSWAILDQKPEKYITVALAAALNGGGRKALTEHLRLDLVLIDKWTQDRKYQLRAGYEAKCEHLARFGGASEARPPRRRKPRRDGRRPADADWYNGGCLAEDLARARGKKDLKKWQGCPVRGGVFYLVEMSPPTHHSKFEPRVPDKSMTVDDAIERIEACVSRRKVGVAHSPTETVSIGNGQNVDVRVHMVLFDADSQSQT
jgi:hypothetical protein